MLVKSKAHQQCSHLRKPFQVSQVVFPLLQTQKESFLICNSEQQLIVECHSVCLTSDLRMRVNGARNRHTVITEATVALEACFCESSCNDDKAKACAWVSGLLLCAKKKRLQTATFAFLQQHKVLVVLFEECEHDTNSVEHSEHGEGNS